MLVWLNASLAMAQVISNPSFNATAPTAIPNTGTFPGWTILDGADVAQASVDIDCASILTASSVNGGQFVRATANGVVNQGVSTTVTGLTPGVAYKVRFEAGLVRHFGQSTGNWDVTFALVPTSAADITLPANNPGQAAWRTQEVGPFPAVETQHLLEFRAKTNSDGVDVSPDLPTDECDYESDLLAVDLLLDGIVLVPDSDSDGLFDDQEALLKTDPFNPDTDLDGLNDFQEFDEFGTDPLDPDSDDDGLFDGTEILVYTDPLLADTDEDGLEDGAEIELGTNALVEDTDGDGFLDGEEVAEGWDPLDPKSPGELPEPTEPTVPTETTTTPGTTDTGVKVDDGEGCGCDQAPPAPAAAWLGAAALLWLRRRSAANR
jgi:Bacterial TSP3 repeat